MMMGTANYYEGPLFSVHGAERSRDEEAIRRIQYDLLVEVLDLGIGTYAREEIRKWAREQGVILPGVMTDEEIEGRMPKHTDNPKILQQREKDHRVLADPDTRGVFKGRRGIGDDQRTPSGNDTGRVERAWKREGRG